MRKACTGTDLKEKEAVASMEASFSGKLEVQKNDHAAEVKELHAKIGQLSVERDFFGRRLQPVGARKEATRK